MEKFERFSEERLTSLRARYRGDDLFRTWTWILCLLEQQLNGLNAVEVWSETEMIRQKLSAIKEHRDVVKISLWRTKESASVRKNRCHHSYCTLHSNV